jgi:hypothetical protein
VWTPEPGQSANLMHSSTGKNMAETLAMVTKIDDMEQSSRSLFDFELTKR